MGIFIRNDLYLTPNIWNSLAGEIAGKVANRTQTHLFFDMGVTRDHARKVTEKAAGFGLGLSYHHKRLTLSGTVGVPRIEDNSFDIGDPVFQARMDVKMW